jgi:hypothetical protein
LFQAFGLKKGSFSFPVLTPSLTVASISAAGKDTSAPPHKGVNAPSGAPTAIGPCNAAQTTANKKLMQQEARHYGWDTGAEWDSLNSIIMSESGYCNTIKNPTSTAYGIGQFLDTTWATVGGSKTSDALTQIRLTLLYIRQRYKTPGNAWNFHLANGWY